MRLVNPQGRKEFREPFSYIQFELSHFAQHVLHSWLSQINAFFIPLETICCTSCRQIWAQISAEVNFKDKCSFSFFLREPSQGVSKGFLPANCRDRMPFRTEHGILRVVVGVMRMLLRPFLPPPMGVRNRVKHWTILAHTWRSQLIPENQLFLQKKVVSKMT